MLEIKGPGKPVEEADEMLLGDEMEVTYEGTLIWSDQGSELFAVISAVATQHINFYMCTHTVTHTHIPTCPHTHRQ